ncbi:hypothetical protein CVT24_000961 [Panaeolus cyanescens]|uniref:3-keto sterol reductase n=1 Tax=Panaeolus cyanescens TaxID=181874 RepID=A0A409YCF6_9AGAR|nr:hypothetical protein CVT24_000961 [Panaeolus cyanescens]
MSVSTLEDRLVVVVTGANGGVGYGICQRLLTQLVQPNGRDARPQAFAKTAGQPTPHPGYQGLTLVMACRNVEKANVACHELLRWFDEYVQELSTEEGFDEAMARNFVENCEVRVEEVDLASFKSVMQFAARLRVKLPYITHLVFNAGTAPFKDLIYWKAALQFFTDPLGFMTYPNFYSQYSGQISKDNLGWIWQSNLFSHFVMARELQHMLEKSPLEEGSRVIWSSSLEAFPDFYDPRDWQLLKTDHSYECVKYQIDLVGTYLDRQALALSPTPRIRHFVSEPGVCSTSISAALTPYPFMNTIKVWVFFFGRLFLNSPHHPIIPFKAAIVAVHLILAPLLFLPTFANNDPDQAIRFGAQTDRWGAERVGQTPVRRWTDFEDSAKELVDHCDELYQSMKKQLESPHET